MLSRDPNLSTNLQKLRGNSDCFFNRTMVKKNGWNQPLEKGGGRVSQMGLSHTVDGRNLFRTNLKP